MRTIISIVRFYSKNIRTVPRKMVSSVKLFTSVDDGKEEEKEKGRRNFSSSSHSERHALRELLALVGSEEATLVEAPVLSTTTTTRKPVLITTSAPRIKLSSQTSSTTKATTQGSNNFILQMTNNKEKGKINNNNKFKLKNKSNVEDLAKMKAKDFLLKMMLVSQDTNSVTKSDLVLQPSKKAKVETKKKQEITTKKAVSGKKEAWQAVSSLTTTFEGGNEEDVFNEEDGFGDNLQLIFKQDDSQQAGHLPRAQEPVLHVEHGEGEAEPRMENSDRLSLDSDLDSAQEEMDHQHHLEQVHVDFNPAVATSEYGSQWLPVFSPSHRVA